MILLLFCLQSHAWQQDSLEMQLRTAQGEDRVRVLYELVIKTQRTDFAKLKQYALEADLLAKQSQNLVLKAYASLAMGTYFNNIGRMDSSILAFTNAEKFGKQVQDTLIQIKATGSLGRTLISAGRAEEALERLFTCLRLLELVPDKNDTEWRVRTNIAWAYLELKQYDDCIRFGLQNLQLMDKRELDWIAVYSYNNVAVAYGALKKYDSAKHLINKSIAITEKNGDIFSLANAYFILGKIYAENNELDQALAQYLKAKPLREKVGNPSYVISDLYAIADLYHQMGKYKNGIESASEAIRLAEQYDLLLKFDGAYLALAKNYEGLRDYKNSSKYYNLWALAKDSVYSHSHADAIAEMQTKYETEKKEQQLALQQAELLSQHVLLQRTYFTIGGLVIITILLIIISLLIRSRYRRKQQLALQERVLAVQEAYIKATIESQENERKRVAQDLHDGMGQLISALRMTVSSLPVLPSDEEKHKTVEKSEKILNDMHREVRAVAFNLMPQTLIQYGLIPALQEMASRLNESTGMKIKISSFDLNNRLTEVHEISIYRIVQEWITNVMKYAEATKIEIDLVVDDDEIRLTIEDNGKGFDTRLLIDSAGNGWKNMQSRTGLLKGTINIDSTPHRSGTTLVLQFPPALTPAENLIQ